MKSGSCLPLLFLLLVVTAMAAPHNKKIVGKAQAKQAKGDLSKAIKKGSVKKADKALGVLESRSSEKAAQSEERVLHQLQKDTAKVKKVEAKAVKGSKLAQAVLEERKKHPNLVPTQKQMKKTKSAIMNAKVADAQRAVARLSRKDAETQVTVMHVKEQAEEAKLKVTEQKAQQQKKKGDSAVSKLSKELRAEKQQVEKAKSEAAKEMQRSEKVDEESGFTNHLTKKQLEVKKSASRHVAKAKKKVAVGYQKMKMAETNAASKVRKYEKIKSTLMTAESSEMQAKGQEATKQKSLAKAKRIEQRQEIKLKNARTTAAEETRNALYVAFGKEGLSNSVTSPLRTELAAALTQEKKQAQQIQHLTTLETKGFREQEKIGSEVTEGKLCASSQANSAQYAECLAGCKAGAGGWYGAAQSCSCFKCRHLLELAMHGSCSCSVGTTSYEERCPAMRAAHKKCTTTCVDESEHCSCGHVANTCCAAAGISCQSGFLWDKKCVLGHPYGYVCELQLTSWTLAIVVAISVVLSMIMYGCLPSMLAWYCCIRRGSQFNWLMGGAKVSGGRGDKGDNL